MSTIAIEELIVQFPPVTPHRLCNPLFCKNKNLKTPSLAKAIEIEEVLLEFFQENRINAIIIAISLGSMNLPSLIADLVTNSMNSNIDSIENKKVLEKFKIDLKNGIVAALVFWEEQGWDELIANILFYTVDIMDQCSGSQCMCSAAHAHTLRFLRIYSANRETNPESRIQDLADFIPHNETYHFQNYHSQMRLVKKWNQEEIKKFTFAIASIIRDVFRVVLEGHEAMIYFKAYDKLIGGVAMLEYGRVMKEIYINYPGVSPMIPFGVKTDLKGLSEMGKSCPRLTLAQRLDMLKKIADNHAHDKDYIRAVSVYGQLNTLPAVDNSVKLNSLTNCAAIRLRISESKPYQLPCVIMECTFALEIDPNHGKALFRRGLALALMKEWNEAIVDFQRAVELDSRSPAAKELAVALRQVGRRIEA